jgi:hypothetical protein
MKTKTIIITLAVIFFGNMASFNAQCKKGSVVIGAGTSVSYLVPLMPELVVAATPTIGTDQTLKVYWSPAINASVDYFIGQRVSIGAGINYQKSGVKYSNHAFYTGSVKRHEDFDLTFSRLNAGARLMFHHVNRKHFDLYQGCRLGYSKWKMTNDSHDKELSFANKAQDAVSWQIIMLGMRFNFDENIGIAGEVGFGAPYYGSISLTAKF